jgi:hypothetical protein
VSLQLQAKAEIERRRRTSDGQQDKYSTFKTKYWNDLDGFARDCIDWGKHELSEYQAEGMRLLVKHRRLSLRGPHGLGKTAFAAIIVLWFALTRDGKDWKIPTLASSWRQVERYLWPEIHKWSKRVKWDLVGRPPLDRNRELLALNLKLSTGAGFAMASNDEALIEGAHGDHILYLFDESKAVPDETWDAAEGAMSTGDCYWLAVSTPGAPVGRFYQIQSRKAGYEDWYAFHVTLEMAVAAGRIDAKWAKNRRRQWGEKSAVYQNRVLGNFAASDEDAVIPLAWLERSNERWLARRDSDDWGRFFGVGVDIGRGGDPSVIAHRFDHVTRNRAITKLEHFHEADIMPVTGRVSNILRSNYNSKAVVDVTGIGAGTVDRLREQDDIADKVYAFIAGGKVAKKDESGELGFADMRSAGYWEVRELLAADTIDLPPDDNLTGDLTTPKYTYKSGGVIQVEKKEDIKKRLGRSTDDGDAVIMIFMDKYAEESQGVWQYKYA